MYYQRWKNMASIDTFNSPSIVRHTFTDYVVSSSVSGERTWGFLYVEFFSVCALG